MDLMSLMGGGGGKTTSSTASSDQGGDTFGGSSLNDSLPLLVMGAIALIALVFAFRGGAK